jgi:alcohol dehydrogenase class IV
MYRTEPFSFFVPTRIEYGAGKVSQLADEVKGLNAKRPLIVTDKGLVKAGALKGIEEQLKENNIEFAVFSDVESNPRDTNVEKAADLARVHKADLMIGVGGGSPMDTAKCAGMLITNGGKIEDWYGYYKIKKQGLPLITVPTTAGTGSEVSIWAVITNTQKEKHVKEVLGSQLMCPTVALVDPLMTVGLPPHLTAYTGMDALSHAIEGYFSLLAEPIADVIALSAIQLITDNLVPATLNGNNLEARDNMMLGSLMAGIVLGVTDCGAIHCLGHAIGGLYDVHHGLAMAIFFPYVMEYNLGACPERFANIARAMGENVDGLPMMEAARKSIDGIVKLLRLLRIPTLKDVGVREQDFEELAKLALADPTSEANPRKMTLEGMIEILRDAYADKFKTAVR